MLFGAVSLVLGTSLRLIPPRHFAVVTCFGRRTGEVRIEGLGLFVLYPWVYAAHLVPAERRTRNISFPQVLSRDFAQIRFEIDLAWTPSPEHGISYVDNGEATGAGSAVDAILKDRLRSRRNRRMVSAY